jgi:hypothetical protein
MGRCAYHIGFVSKFDANTADDRSNFYTNGQSLSITDVGTFTDGYAIAKWKNVTAAGAPGSDGSGTFADTDFPMFRLADAYLMYRMCRKNRPAQTEGLNYVNMVRQRAYGSAAAGITIYGP